VDVDGQDRDRYQAMALAAFALLGSRNGRRDDDEDDDEFEEARHEGFRDAIAVIESAIAVLCLDCDENTIALDEYYMLRDPVWLEANPDGDGCCASAAS
jgi:hypothetical protein